MRAIQIEEFGAPEVLQTADLPTPVAGPGQVLVRTEAVGVNFIDTYYRQGIYPTPLPFIPGDEGAGVVVETGEGVDEGLLGTRVAWTAPGNTYAEFVAVPANVVVPVPEGLDGAVAASALAQGMTAHYLAHSMWPLEPGDPVLIHAGAGGVGLLLTQMAAALGTHVITTVSTEAKAELSRAAGARHVLRYGSEVAINDLPTAIRDLTGGTGVAVAYDGVGQSTFDASLASVRRRGLLALYGAASGPVPPVDPQRLNAAGSVFLARPTIGDFLRDRNELLWRAGAVLDGIADGSLTLRIGARFPLAKASEAHRALESRATSGAVVLLP